MPSARTPFFFSSEELLEPPEPLELPELLEECFFFLTGSSSSALFWSVVTVVLGWTSFPPACTPETLSPVITFVFSVETCTPSSPAWTSPTLPAPLIWVPFALASTLDTVPSFSTWILAFSAPVSTCTAPIFPFSTVRDNGLEICTLSKSPDNFVSLERVTSPKELSAAVKLVWMGCTARTPFPAVVLENSTPSAPPRTRILPSTFTLSSFTRCAPSAMIKSPLTVTLRKEASSFRTMRLPSRLASAVFPSSAMFPANW